MLKGKKDSSRHYHLIQNNPHAGAPSRALIDLIDQSQRPFFQLPQRGPAILEAACTLHVGDGVALDAWVGGFLLEDVEELEVVRIGADAVDDGEGEFSLGQVFAEAFVVGVFRAGEVHVVVADLEN